MSSSLGYNEWGSNCLPNVPFLLATGGFFDTHWLLPLAPAKLQLHCVWHQREGPDYKGVNVMFVGGAQWPPTEDEDTGVGSGQLPHYFSPALQIRGNTLSNGSVAQDANSDVPDAVGLL